MKKSELVNAAKELNKVLGLEPKIDVALPVATLKKLVGEAAGLVEPTDAITPATALVLEELAGTPAPKEEVKKAAPKAKAKAAPVEEDDEDDEEEEEEAWEEDDDDDEELVVIEEDEETAPAPKAKKATPKAKAKKETRLTRPNAVARAIKSVDSGDSITVGEAVTLADDIYGTSNISETTLYLRVVVGILEEWGVVKQDGDTIQVL